MLNGLCGGDGSMDFMIWGASVGWIAVGASVDRVVNVQCYMVCVV